MKRLDELEVKLFDTGVLRAEEATDVPAISKIVPPKLETRLRSSEPCHKCCRARAYENRGRTYWID